MPHIDKMSLCYEVISSFVIFAVLDLQVCGCRLYKARKRLSFFTIIFAVFLYDLASAYQISSKFNWTTHGEVMTSYRFFKMAAIESEIYFRLRF